ncbi:hypothetical protein Ancab_013346 [Ancistrocladus abbreviatus]
MNRLILEKDGMEIDHVRAEEVWAIGRALGISYDGNEQELLQRITNMEKRDKAEWEQSKRAEEVGQEFIQRVDVDLVLFQESKLMGVSNKLCLSLWRFLKVLSGKRRVHRTPLAVFAFGILLVWLGEPFRSSFLRLGGRWGEDVSSVHLFNFFGAHCGEASGFDSFSCLSRGRVLLRAVGVLSPFPFLLRGVGFLFRSV